MRIQDSSIKFILRFDIGYKSAGGVPSNKFIMRNGHVLFSGYQSALYQVYLRILPATPEPVLDAWFSVGDERDITLSDGTVITLQIYDIHSHKITGSENKALLTLGSKDTGGVELSSMNPSYNNIGGWHSSAMRAYLNSTFISKIPAELMLLLESVDIITSEGNQSSALIIDSDKIFLPAMKEVGLINERVSALENDALSSLAIFTTNASRIKTGYWWTRSPDTNSAGNFFAIAPNGTGTSSSAAYSYNSIFCCCL